MLFVFVFTVSCSSEDSDPVDNPGPEETYFDCTVDDEDLPMTIISCTRKENMFLVAAETEDGKFIEIAFDSFGTLGKIYSGSPNPSQFPARYNHRYFRKNYFNFELISVSDTQVKATFSGKLYEDLTDLTSDFAVVEGSFLVDYTTVQPTVPGLGAFAKINGNNWYATSDNYTSHNPTTSLHYYSDDEYSLSFVVGTQINVGNYSFDAESTEYAVVLSKYKTATDKYEDFTSTSGTLNITAVSLPYIEGTFTLNAQDPATGATVVVTEGEFKVPVYF